MKLFNTLVCLFLVAVLFTASSCKKDKQISCMVKTVRAGSNTFIFEFDASGYETKRTDSATGDYDLTTVSGNLLARQSYNSGGVANGSPHYSVINSAGLIIQGIESDTTFITYDSNGQITKTTKGSGANVTGWTDYTNENGNVITSVQHNASGSITHSTTVDYYTDKPNKSNLSLIYSFLSDARSGKATKNLIKKVTNSDGTAVNESIVTYTIDGNGYVTDFTILEQPANTLMTISITYNCN